MKKRLIKKREIVMINLVLSILVISILASLVIAQNDWPTYNVCCEKTKYGAWCQNSKENSCDTGTDPKTGSKYRTTPTSCESTSFCRPGCCIDTTEGLCMKNTPQKVCEISYGTWIEDANCNVPQCNLGCCVLGDQASFVTLTRCKRLSLIYGLETNFKQDIENEASCILTAHYSDQGACVYEKEGTRTCRFTSRKGCLDMGGETYGINTSSGSPEFFKDYLCSADELATVCGPTEKTTCIEGKDEVYFVDSCGNTANIYDSKRAKDSAYWRKIEPKANSCGFKRSDGNIDSKSCGNCDYLEGSICSEGGNPDMGDYYCQDLNCYNTENGNSYKNGESWCMSQGEVGKGLDPVGSRFFRHICIHGEEVIEPCADFRNEVCIQQNVPTSNGDFIEAGCRVNRWSDCIDQFTEDGCLNTDKRDCYWVSGAHYDGSQSDKGVKQIADKSNFNNDNSGIFGDAFSSGDDEQEQYMKENSNGILGGGHICLPEHPPGLEFWSDGNAKAICSLGNSQQVVRFEQNIWGTRTCKENCEVLQQKWIDNMNQVCKSLGDCGNYVNILGRYTDDGITYKRNGKTVIGGMLTTVKEAAEEAEIKKDVENFQQGGESNETTTK